MNFGEQIKVLREEQNLLQRQVANELDMDTAMLSKIERGDRRAKKEHIPILARLYHADEKELLTLWYAEQVYDVIKEEDNPDEILRVAEQTIKYNKK